MITIGDFKYLLEKNGIEVYGLVPILYTNDDINKLKVGSIASYQLSKLISYTVSEMINLYKILSRKDKI